ncbi:hypothetical protein ACUR5C_12930 [Aliikangiella sp. IMCC44653]
MKIEEIIDSYYDQTELASDIVKSTESKVSELELLRIKECLLELTIRGHHLFKELRRAYLDIFDTLQLTNHELLSLQTTHIEHGELLKRYFQLTSKHLHQVNVKDITALEEIEQLETLIHDVTIP